MSSECTCGLSNDPKATTKVVQGFTTGKNQVEMNLPKTKRLFFTK